MRRRIAISAAAATMFLPAAAQAHVSVHPNTVPAGAFVTLDLRVPGEQEGANVTKVAVQMPPGFIGVDYEPVSGWTTKVLEGKLAKAIETDDGPVDSQVSQIDWTWTGPLGKVGDGQFIDLPLSVAIPDDAAGKSLEFRTVETYSDGHVSHWIASSLEADEPAPRINVTAKAGVVQDIAGDEAGPRPGQTPSVSPATSTVPVQAARGSDASKGLGIAALALGALGVLIGIVALTTVRRRSGG